MYCPRLPVHYKELNSWIEPPSRASQFLDTCPSGYPKTDCPRVCLSHANQQIPSQQTVPLTTSFVRLSLQATLLLAYHLRISFQTTRESHYVLQSPLVLLKPDHPKPAYLALPISSLRNHSKGFCLHQPLSFICLLTDPTLPPVALHPPFENCE